MADKLYFYSKSKDAKPGRGVREQVGDPSAYAGLASIPHWRRVLSNFHAGKKPFLYKNLHWQTIEHAFQAVKLGRIRQEFFKVFSVESGTELGCAEDGLAARKKRKWALLSPSQLAEWNAQSEAVMAEIARAKYATDAEARRVLLATGKAELWHVVPRGQPIRFRHLELLREELL